LIDRFACEEPLWRSLLYNPIWPDRNLQRKKYIDCSVLSLIDLVKEMW
jgi:hypothetical protein